MTSIDRTYAVVVAIESYPYLPPNWKLQGAVAQASQFAAWLVKDRHMPASNIQVFQSEQDIKPFTSLGIPKEQCADASAPLINHFFAGIGSHWPQGEVLFIYWIGHGCVDGCGQRRLFAGDASPSLKTNLDISQLIKVLYSDQVGRFRHQIAFIDACAKFFEDFKSGTKLPPGGLNENPNLVSGITLSFYFAVSSGEYAKNNAFGPQALTFLRTLPDEPWPPDTDTLLSGLKETLRQLSDRHPAWLEYRDKLDSQWLFAAGRIRPHTEDFFNLRPIEKELGISPEGKPLGQPEFFRKTGPSAVDFDAGKVYRRREVLEIRQRFKDQSIILLKGAAASGKSVVARQVVYDLYQDGWTIYILSLKQTVKFNHEGLQREIERLGNDRSLVLLEDIHISPSEINHILGFCQPNWPSLLLTTRQVDFDVLRGELNNFEGIPIIEIEPIDASSEIISLYCKEYGIESKPKIINNVTNISKGSLWILAYSLLALKSSNWADIREESIRDEVKKDLLGLAEINGTRSVQLLIALSILYRFEILTDARFIEDALPGSQDILMKLADLGEAIKKEESASVFYGLPHSSLAYLYFKLITRFDTQFYRNDVDFIRRYLLSELTENADDILDKEFIFDMVVEVLGENDMAVLASRIITSDLSGAAHAIKEVYGNDPVKGMALVAALDISRLGLQIERQLLKELDEPRPDPTSTWGIFWESTSWDWNGSKVVSAVESIDPCKGEQLVFSLDISKLARHIENADIWKCASAIEKIPEENPTLGRLLLDAIDISRIAGRFHKADDLRGAIKLLESLQETNMDKARAFATAVDWNRLAFGIENSAKLWDVGTTIEMVQKVEQTKAQELVEALDLSQLSRRIEKADFIDSSNVIEAIYAVDQTKGQALLDILDVSCLARSFENAEYLSNDSAALERLYKVDPARTLALVSELDETRLAKRVNEQHALDVDKEDLDGNEVDLSAVAAVIKAVHTIDSCKANALVAALDLDRLARRVEEGDLSGADDVVEALKAVDAAKLNALVAALDLVRVARQVEYEPFFGGAFLNTIGPINSEVAKAIVTHLNLDRVAGYFEEDLNLDTRLIEEIQAVNPTKAQAVIGMLDLSRVSRNIETYHNGAGAIKMFQEIDPVRAKALVDSLNLSNLALQVEKGDHNFWQIVGAVDGVDRAKGQELWGMLKLPRLAYNLMTASDLWPLQQFIETLQQSGASKTEAFVAALDLPLLTSRIDGSDNPCLVVQLIKAVQDVDPVKGGELANQIDFQRVFDRLDLTTLARALEENCEDTTQNLPELIDFLEAVQAIYPVALSALTSELVPSRIAKNISDSWDLFWAAEIVELIKTVDLGKAKEIVAELDLTRVLYRLEDTERLLDIIGFINAIKNIEEAKARELIAALDLSHLARRIEKSPKLINTASLINVVYQANAARGQALLSLVDISRLVSQIREIVSADIDLAAGIIKCIKQVDPGKGEQIIQVLSDLPKLQELLVRGSVKESPNSDINPTQ